MANSEHDTEATLSRDGVTVYQTFTTEEFGVPTVALKLVSDRSGPVRVGLAVDLPVDLDIEKIGFHPEYLEDGWTVGDGEISFEADLDSNGELTTMYAIDSPTTEQQTALLDSLSVERVDPVSRDDVDTSTLVELDEDDVRSLDPSDTNEASSSDPAESESGGGASGSGATPARAGPGAEPGEPTTSEAPTDEPRDTGAGPAPTEEPREETTAPPGRATGASAGSAEPTELSAYSAEALVAELDRRASGDDLPEETRQRIEALGSERTDVGELDARLSHLQKRMSDMEAYTDPVRDLHEEHGHPVEVIDRLERRLEEFGDQLEAIDGRVTALDESVADIEPQFEEVATDVESVRSEVATVRDDVESVESEQRRIASKLSDLSEWRDSVTSALDALGGK